MPEAAEDAARPSPRVLRRRRLSVAEQALQDTEDAAEALQQLVAGEEGGNGRVFFAGLEQQVGGSVCRAGAGQGRPREGGVGAGG